MAYYQFDLTFVNLAALQASGGTLIVDSVPAPGSGASGSGTIPASGDLTVSVSTLNPDYGRPAFELDPSDEIWFLVFVYVNNVTVHAKMIGPYLVGDIGSVVTP